MIDTTFEDYGENYTYALQNTYLDYTLRLTDVEGNPVTNTSLEYTIKFYGADGEELNNKILLRRVATDSNGLALFHILYNYTHDFDVDAVLTVNYGGNNEYNPTSTTINLAWLRKVWVDFKDVKFKREYRYPEIPYVSGKLTSMGKPLANYLLEFRIDNEIIATTDTGEDGSFKFLANVPYRGEISYDFVVNFHETENYYAYDVHGYFLRTKDKTNIMIDEGETLLYVHQTADLDMGLYHGDAVMVNKTVTAEIYVVPTREGYEDYVLDDSIAHQTFTTDENGKFNLSLYLELAGRYYVSLVYDGDDLYEGFMYDFIIKSSRIPIVFNLITAPEQAYLQDEPEIKFQLKSINNVAIGNKTVQCDMDIYDMEDNFIETVYSSEINKYQIRTESNGYVTFNPTYANKGSTKGYLHFHAYEDDIHTSQDYYLNIQWNKIQPVLSINSRTEETEVTLAGKITVQARKSHNNEVIAGMSITKSLTFKDFNNNTITSESYNTVNTTTASGGTTTVQYTPTHMGDIIGTAVFEHTVDDVYETASLTSNIKWNKIETKITSKNLTHYNGKYTNLVDGEPNWNTESPGVNSNYTNLWAKLEATNTETTYTTLANQNLKFITSSNTVLSTVTTNSNGEVVERYTRTVNNPPTTSIFKVAFEETNLFKPSTVQFTVKTLARIGTDITPFFEEYEDNEMFIYNIPFMIKGRLTELTVDGWGIIGAKVNVTYNNQLQGTYTTDNEGVFGFKKIPYTAGEKEIVYEYNTDDLIDKYLPVTISYTVDIDKDTPTLVITTGTNKYISCGEALLKFLLTDRLNRPIQNHIINVKYDDGTYSDEHLMDLGSVTTGSDGKTTCNIEAYSGIRVIRGTSKETSNYYSVSAGTYVEYDISRTYIASVTDGVAEIPVECLLNVSKGLPNGLYDVVLEYTPAEAETGKCVLYGVSTNKQTIRKKNGTKLECLTEPLESEAYHPLFVTTELSNYKNEVLKNMNEISRVNGKDESNPPHVTSNLGQVSRGAVGTVNNEKIEYYFKSEETREYAGTTLEVEGNTTKMQPVLEVAEEEMTGYSEVKMTLQATLYHTYKKYDNFGYEVKKDTNNNEVYYDSLNNSYYKLISGNKVSCSRQDYLNAKSIVTKNLLSGRTVVWRGTSGVTELVRATTDKNGVATVQYGRRSVGTVTIYATTEEEKNYLSCTTPIIIHTLERITPVFEEIDFSDNHTIYKHPTTLYTHLFLEENGTRTPFVNQQVVFKQTEKTLGTATTDNNGYAEITYTPTSELTFPYQVIFRTHDQYLSTSKVYRIPVDKQTPQLTIRVNKSTTTMGDTITITATMKEDTTSGSAKIQNYSLLFKDGNQNIQYLRTDENGEATITYTTKYAGNRTFSVYYDGSSSNRYNSTEATINVTVNKIGTKIECVEGNPLEIPGDTTAKLTFTLKNQNNETLLGKQIQITYNNTQKTLTTNNYGQISMETGTYSQGTTKDMLLSFAGDDNHKSSNLTENLTWGQPLNREDCSNLDNFDIIYENWYASDGQSKWGLDVDGLNLLDSQTANNNDIYKNQCTPILNTSYKLRQICGNIVTTRDELERLFNEENKIVAPTGVAVRSKRIKTTNNCTIHFYFKINYDKSNESYNGNNKNLLMGGHFGLIDGGNLTTAEKAPVRLEFYRGNSYMILSGGKATYSNLRYTLNPSEEYSVQMDILNKDITITFYDSNGKKVVEPQTWTAQNSLENLYPYAFAYTNGTAFVLREIEITRK